MSKSDLIRQALQEGKKPREISLILNVSKQLISLVKLKDYPKLYLASLRSYEKNDVILRDRFICQVGTNCGQKLVPTVKMLFVSFHSKKHNTDNTMLCCTACKDGYRNVVLGIKKRDYICSVCSKNNERDDIIFTTREKIKTIVCKLCLKNGKTYWSKKHKLDYCKGCGTKKRRHWGQGMCHRCWQKFKWDNDPEFKIRFSQAAQKWYLKNRNHMLAKMKEYNNSRNSKSGQNVDKKP